MRFLNLSILISFLIYSCNLFADETNKLTICSLNLYRLGEKGFKNESPEFLSQRKYLADRIIDEDCDIIALQELVGKKKSKSAAVLHNLINYIHSKSEHRLYKFLLGESNDSWNRNAFIYDSEFLNYKNFKSWNKQTLIKDDIRSSPWSHTRGPISVFFNFKKNKFNIKEDILVVNYHLKSKASGWKDPLGTKFEYQRMLSANGIRDIIKSETNNVPVMPIVVLLGDRNSSNSGASSEVLSGRLNAVDFFRKGTCKISPEGSALCPPETFRTPDMIPVLQNKEIELGRKIGTYRIGRRLEILDEIYLSSNYYELVLGPRGEIRSKTVGEFKKGSDHLLSLVELVFK